MAEGTDGNGLAMDIVVIGPAGAAAAWDELADQRPSAPTRVERPGALSWLVVATRRGRVLGYLHGRRIRSGSPRDRLIRAAGLCPEQRESWLSGGLSIIETVLSAAGRADGALRSLVSAIAPLGTAGRAWATLNPHEVRLRDAYRDQGWVEVCTGLLLASTHPAVISGAAVTGSADVRPAPWTAWPPSTTRTAGRTGPEVPASLDVLEIL